MNIGAEWWAALVAGLGLIVAGFAGFSGHDAPVAVKTSAVQGEKNTPEVDPTLPRGIRNKNPLNIEHDGDNWRGLDDPPSDGRYCRFIDERFGIRAAARILATYTGRDPDVLTLPEIIGQWAPDSENDTRSYVLSVSARSGLNNLEPITRDKWPRLLEAMIYHENGVQPYSMATIREGVSWA